MNAAFAIAVQLTESIYSTAVIHCVAEQRDSKWCNLYTSVIYGREIDLLSVPTYVDHTTYGPDLLCLRTRVERPTAELILAAARQGSATYDSWTVEYDIEETVAGFRPAGVPSDLNDKSFWDISLWCREGIGARKEFNRQKLQRSNAWKVAEYLKCLAEVRWTPIPLAHHPEKLGDLDEIWPTPITIEVSGVGNQCSFQVASIDPTLFDREVITSGTLIRHDLVVGAVHFTGKGPHSVEEDFTAMDVSTTVDGVPMDVQSHRFWRSFKMSMTSYGDDVYQVPANKAQREMKVLIPHRHSVPRMIGTQPASLVRHEAWIVGRLFRFYGQPTDAEHVYDPKDSDSPSRALRHLQEYGRDQKEPEIVVADPYILDERAMHAIAVMAIRENRVSTIHILTQFKSGAESYSPSTPLNSPDQGTESERATSRAKTIAKAKETAQKIATQLKVKMSFYGIEKLHDRFLIVGERVWHVGCSFNQIGQEITAVVEMRDDRAKDAVMGIFKRSLSNAPEFEVNP